MGARCSPAAGPDRSLNIFDFATGKTVVRLPLPMEPRHFCVSSDGGELFLSGDGMDAVVIVFPYSTEIWQTVLAGRAPGVLALTESPSLLLVANPETNSLTVLDAKPKAGRAGGSGRTAQRAAPHAGPAVRPRVE